MEVLITINPESPDNMNLRYHLPNDKQRFISEMQIILNWLNDTNPNGSNLTENFIESVWNPLRKQK